MSQQIKKQGSRVFPTLPVVEAAKRLQKNTKENAPADIGRGVWIARVGARKKMPTCFIRRDNRRKADALWGEMSVLALAIVIMLLETPMRGGMK